MHATTDEILTLVVRQGTDHAIILDPAIVEAMGIGESTLLRISRRGAELVLTPITPEEARKEQFNQAMTETAAENAELFRRLAK